MRDNHFESCGLKCETKKLLGISIETQNNITVTRDTNILYISGRASDVWVIGTKSLNSRVVSELTTNDSCILDVPAIITDCAPRSVDQDFHPSLSGVRPVHQTYSDFLGILSFKH